MTLPDEGGLSSTANVQRVKVSLPKQLPTPLKTLQKACLEKTFAENPKNCPVASQVGTVKVSTPVLPGGLTGTAYFVSHGGAKYPELIMVLVGQNGVTVQVHGETQISKAGITTATFATVPDVPFLSFELTLPQREFPALTANGNLCKGTLLMPTELVGQNGLVIDQSTKIAVTGCPKAKKAGHKEAKPRRRPRAGGARSGSNGRGAGHAHTHDGIPGLVPVGGLCAAIITHPRSISAARTMCELARVDARGSGVPEILQILGSASCALRSRAGAPGRKRAQ